MVLNDIRSIIIPVSTCVRGLYLPVPSVLTSNGISRIVDLPLIDSEQVALHGGSTLA